MSENKAENNIQEKMLEAIKRNDNNYFVGNGEVTLKIVPNELEAAAIDCATICDNEMIRFAEWMHINSVYAGNGNYRVIEALDQFQQLQTLPELLQLFKQSK